MYLHVMKIAYRNMFNQATSLVTAFALFLAPIICCCAGPADAMAAAETTISIDIRDCGHESASAELANPWDGQPENSHSDCTECDDIGVAERSIGSFLLPGAEWNLDPHTAVGPIGTASPAQSAETVPCLRRGPPPAVATTLVELSILLLV